MEAYDLENDKIVDWATNYASYDELESAAKAIYAVYVERRKKERPELQSRAKQYKNKKWAGNGK